MKKALNKILFYLIIFSIWAFLKIMKRLDSNLRKSLKDFNGKYLFCCGTSAIQLIFNEGGLSVKRGHVNNPDFQLIFVDIPGAIKVARKHPGDMIRLLLENKIHKKGNIFYLFQFGYFFGLCGLYVDNFLSKFTRTGKIRNAA